MLSCIFAYFRPITCIPVLEHLGQTAFDLHSMSVKRRQGVSRSLRLRSVLIDRPPKTAFPPDLWLIIITWGKGGGGGGNFSANIIALYCLVFVGVCN